MKALAPLALPLTGTTLIEASAGTGKTHTITTLVVRLLLERELEIGQILVVTYTRAATFELRERVRARLLAGLSTLAAPASGDDSELRELFAARETHAHDDRKALQRALRDFDQAAIFTIHGFCQRVLAEHAFESAAPFELELSEDEQPLLQEIALDYYARVAYEADPELVGALDANRVAPSSLSDLARATAPDPGLIVLPELVAAHAPELAIERLLAAQRGAAEAWRADRAALLAALTSGALHGAWYKPKDVLGGWADALDALGSFAPWAIPDCVNRLTPEALRKGIKQGQRFNVDHPFFAAAAELSAAHTQVSQHGAAHALHVRRGLVDYARAELARRRDALGVRGFDDLLQRLDAALEGASGERLQRVLGERHPAALIDEFQDTDPVQYRIFARCYRGEGRSLFLIGDPKQAIYGFRGADVFAYLEAARDARDTTFTLGINRRSDPALLTALNTLWTRGPQPFLLPQIRFLPVRALAGAQNRLRGPGAALQLLLLPSGEKPTNKGRGEARVPALIAAEVSQLLASETELDGRRVLPRDIAVLCRTNSQARATQDALAKLGIPTVLDGDSNVLESETADELSQVLWAVAAPSDGRKLGAALISTLLGVGAEALERLRSAGEGEQDWLERFAAWNQLWHARGFMPMFHALLDDADVRARLLARSDGERRLTDLLHLGELLHDAATRQHLGPLALLQWLGEMRNDRSKRAELAGESAQVRLEHDEHALRIATIHRSKGLEYPIVFAPFLWTSWSMRDAPPRFHDPADHYARKLDLGSSQLDDHKQLARDEELAEALRIAYVAITRAKHRCYLVWGRFTQSGQSPLGYLLHHGPGQLEPAGVEAALKLIPHDAALRTALEPLAIRSEGTIELRAIAEDAVAFRAAAEHVERLSARSASRELRAELRATSFSRLTAEPEPSSGDVRPDVDGNALADVEPAPLPAQPLALHELPAGPGPGTLIHSIYEQIDFERADPAQLPEQAARALRAFGLDAERLQAGVVLGIDQSLRTPLDAGDPSFTLASIAASQRLNELEFTLCTPGAARLSPARLAAVFERAAIGERLPNYAERVRALPSAAPAQFLKGFIDLVFRRAGRWYVVDYKSNLLGLEPAAYAQPALAHAMAEHHYVLQYHLYTLALHRYLQLRVPGYDYARDFGGAYYLFLRGMAPEHPSGTGVFFDRPTEETLAALSDALGLAESTP
ncbi:MAG TPA: exodeoxyribonuclease V subunit beta [Polyangiales bacterium]|nr:exodeoxyribonuclease V subunit beta [Polyangiales bacterium]